MTKLGNNNKVAYEAQPSVSLMFLSHVDVFLIYPCTASQQSEIYWSYDKISKMLLTVSQSVSKNQ